MVRRISFSERHVTIKRMSDGITGSVERDREEERNASADSNAMTVIILNGDWLSIFELF